MSGLSANSGAMTSFADGHRADVVDVRLDRRLDVRLVHVVHVGDGVHRVLDAERDAHVVRPDDHALVRDAELQPAGVALQVHLEEVARPRHGHREVAVLERARVALVVVPADDPVVLLLLSAGPPPPATGPGVEVAGSTPWPTITRPAQVRAVVEHADLPLERRIEQIHHARDLRLRGSQCLDLLRVPSDAGEPRLPRHGERVPRVVRGVLHGHARVRVEVRTFVRGQRHQVVQPEQRVQRRAVRDDDDVPARRLPGRQLRLDLAEEPLVRVDRLAVLDLDAGRRP